MKRHVKNPQTRTSHHGPRHLTVLYYFDSRRTKSLRVSLPFLIAGASLAAILVLWALISPFFIFEYRRQLTEKDRRTTELLAKVFDYQTKYENVFEKAYPPSEHVAQNTTAEAKTPVVSKPESPQSAKPKESEAHDKANPSKQASEDLKPAQTPPPSVTAAAVKPEGVPDKAQLASDDADVPVGVESMKTSFNDEKLTTTFALKNLANPAKTEGSIMGVAIFEKTNGEKITITNPLNQSLNSDGSPQSMRKAVSFSIRYYKTKSMEFARPTAEGQFTSLTIYVSGKKSHTQKKFVYSLKDVKKEQQPGAVPPPSPEGGEADEPEGESGAAAPQSALQNEVGERADNGQDQHDQAEGHH